ncbi:4Fe-4S dicluster domain-containing protein [Lacrimispora sphenoides]|uniref:4Fe-4S dicluster domain-containing protein n=1 Tax=Lacrimispora sphenoides TaxID=29370 RepID=UPI0008C1D156|nr:4Fe-4S dicluster domain-containing protein [Lacrimispora sphenoides]SET90740.1 4Fe-4S dicluster domain-containing protein [Lacrimispora sphenoides]
MKKIPILFEKKEDCCGCTACYAICAKKAIVMLDDDEEFKYPHIDEEKCVRCYACVKVCPIKQQKSRG